MKIEVIIDDIKFDSIVRKALIDTYFGIENEQDLHKEAKALRKVIKFYSTASEWEAFKADYAKL